MPTTDDPILLYDGVCGYCNEVVRFIARIDRAQRIRFAPLQSDLARGVIERHPEIQGLDAAVFVEHLGSSAERVRTKWAMTRGLWRYLSGFWKVGCQILALIPLPIANALYDIIAKYRYRIFGKYETCKLPDEKLRRRLVDFPE